MEHRERLGFASFAVVPALERPDLSPLEIWARTTSRAGFPPAAAATRMMAVTMRTVDQIKYAKTLPDPFHLGVAGRCRYYLLTCGAVFSVVARPFLDTDALERGVERADIDGGVKLLPRTQPSLEAARYGVTIEARPGAVREGRPRPFGYDVQVRQSGRLVARVPHGRALRGAPRVAWSRRALPDRSAQRRIALSAPSAIRTNVRMMEREWLAQRLEAGASIEAIAREVGRDPSTVSYWARKHGLASTHAERHAARGPIDREVLAEIVRCELSIRDMAEVFDRSPTAVRHWLHRHGIETSRMRRGRLGKAALASGADAADLPCPQPRDDPSCAASRRLSVRSVSCRSRGGQTAPHQATARA